MWEYIYVSTVIIQNFSKTQHCAAKNAEKHAPTEVIELSSSPDERHPAKSKSGCEIFSQNNKNQHSKTELEIKHRSTKII